LHVEQMTMGQAGHLMHGADFVAVHV
jgi:hypothetical protein